MKILLAATLLFLFFTYPAAHAHKGKKHLSAESETVPKLGVLDKKELSTSKTLKKINDQYLEKAKKHMEMTNDFPFEGQKCLQTNTFPIWHLKVVSMLIVLLQDES